MNQLNSVTLRGIVKDARVETRENGRLTLHPTVLTIYKYQTQRGIVSESKLTPCTVYESRENGRAVLLSVQKDSLVTVKGRLKDTGPKDGPQKTIVVASKISLHKVDYLQPETDL